VYVASQLAEPLPASAFDQFVARITSSLQFQKTLSAEPPLSPQQLALLVKGLAQANFPFASNPKLIEFTTQHVGECASSFSVLECVSLVVVLHNLKTSSLDRTMDLLLANISSSLSVASASVASEVALMLSKIGLRNITILTAAGERLKSANPKLPEMVTFCVAMRELKFHQALRKLCLAASFPQESFSLSDDHVLLLFSSGADFPSHWKLGEKALQALKTSTCMMLVGMEAPNLPLILEVIFSRPPCESLDAEILARCLSKVKGNDIVNMLKSGACAIPELSASEISSICEHAVKFGINSGSNGGFFRLLGRKIFQLSEAMTVDQAVSCLFIYAKNNVRDDRVLKALFQRIGKRQKGVALSNTLASRVKFCISRLGPQWAGDLPASLKG
jgi:hypothetical protein